MLEDHTNAGFALALVLGLGAACQWVAWRTRLPAIVVLLGTGIVVGPVSGLLRPDEMLGDILFPIVSAFAALVLFEGGLSIRIDQLQRAGPWVLRLTTVGLLVTWTAVTACGMAFLGLRFDVALLLGAILVVTGPTVIGPLIRQLRPRAPLDAVANIEGVVNDPIGAFLSVLVFLVIQSDQVDFAAVTVLFAVIKAVVASALIGITAAVLFVGSVSAGFMPKHIQAHASVALVLTAEALAEAVQPGGGLLAVTVMGVAMAAQPFADVEDLRELHAHLRSTLIGTLFIVLAARFALDRLGEVPIPVILFLVGLLVTRVVAVFTSLSLTTATVREMAFLSSIAPRGIVAAAMASVFDFSLDPERVPGVELIVPVTFLAIATTALVYGSFSPLITKKLGLRAPDELST